MPWQGSWGSMRYHAYTKTQSIRHRDKAQFGRSDLSLSDTIQLAQSSNGHCEACGCALLFEHYKPRCFYQWSLDRINRDLPHSKENVRVVCSYCNLGGLGRRKPPCRMGCHRGEIPWGSAPCAAPEPQDVPCPKWRRDILIAQLATYEWQETKRRRVEASADILAG